MFELSDKLKSAIEEYALEQNIPEHDELKVTRASLNGDSFAADVLRITIPCASKQSEDAPEERGNAAPYREVKLIAKVAPKTQFRRDMYNISTLFEREHFMYTILLPELKEFESKHCPARPIFDNYPQLIKSFNEPQDEFILLSDVCDEGFKNFVRAEGVSPEVCRFIFGKFAKLHAISFVFQSVDKKRFDDILGENLKESLFVEELPESFAGFLKHKVELVKEKLMERPKEEIDALVLERLEIFGKNCAKEMSAVCHVRDYAVICHGDSWISNFMYKEDEDGKLQDLKIVDFQMSRFTTPVIDLAYFIGCSTDAKLRKHLPELLLYYYNRLMEEIRSMGHSSPGDLYPYEVFQSHCKKFMVFGFGMAMMSLHSITCPEEDMPDIYALLETCSYEKINEITQTLSSNPAYCKRITDLVRDMVQFGYL